MARKRSHKETGSSNDDDATSSISKIKTRRKEMTNERRRTRPTRTKVEENGLTSKTRSVKRDSTSVPKKSERRKSGVHSIQTTSPSRSLQNIPNKTRKIKNDIQSKNSEKSTSQPQKNSPSSKDSTGKILPQKKEAKRKMKQTPKDLDDSKGSEQQAPQNSDTEFIQLSSAGNTTSSLVSASEQDSLSDDMMTLTQEQGRRSSGRVRKPTHKAAAAQETKRVQSKQSSPRKKVSTSRENQNAPAKITDSLAVNGHTSVCAAVSSESSITKCDSSTNYLSDSEKFDEATKVLCDQKTECASSTNICTDVQEADKDRNISLDKKSECISFTNSHANTQELDVVTNLSSDKTKSVTAGADSPSERGLFDSSPYIVVSQLEKNVQIHTITPVSLSQKPGHGHRKGHSSSNKVNAPTHKFAQGDTSISKTLVEGHDKPCLKTKSPGNRTKGATGSPNQEVTLHAGRGEIVAVRADAAVQVSLETRHTMVSSGTQVDSDLPQQKAESDQGSSVDLLRPGSTSKTPGVDLNALLTMHESNEKVLGGVSALIKDSLMQIGGMRHFVTHDLPALTNVACFQTADKMAISGTIQGISRAWSILTNIEHTVHSKDPKSKKSVKIQWTGKNGMKKTVEFRKTPESQTASLTPTMSNKVVTVFVDIKSPEDEMNPSKEVEPTPVREEGPSPLKHKRSSENVDNSTTMQNETAPKKQVSLLSGKSFSMSHIKMEGKIGVPVSNQNKEDVDGSSTGYTITVADDDVGPGDTVIAEYNFASNPIKPSTDNRVEKEHCSQNVITEVRSGSKKTPPSDANVGGSQNDESDDDGYDYGDAGTWEGEDNEVITVTQSGEFMCGQCPQVFPSRPDLISHRLQFHEKIDNPEAAPSFVECGKCSQRFRCRLELHRHERRAHSLVSLLPKTNPVSYACNVCDKQFSEKRYLTTHLKRHTGIKRHCCPICGWRFFEAHKLKFHLETHKSEEDRQLPYRCTICQRQYHNRQSWNDHMNTHTGSKPYTCSICGTGFAHRIGLHRHKLTHEKDCQYKCPYCSRGFKVKANLKAHLTIHTGIGKHSCPVCKKVFTVATSLRRHKCQPPEPKQEELSEESGDGPYMFMCGVCNVTFSTLAEAETHSLTHVDDTSPDMSLVGVQVEEVGEESNVLSSNTNETSTTYIIESDNSVKTMVISSMQNPGDREGLVDEVEKIQIAASTLADLSSMSTSAEPSPPGKEIQTICPVEDVSAMSTSAEPSLPGKEIQTICPVGDVSGMEIQTVAAESLVSSENVSGKETQRHTASGSLISEDVSGKETGIHTASASLTSEHVSGIEMHTITADGSAPLENVSSKETLTASGSWTSEVVSGIEIHTVRADGSAPLENVSSKETLPASGSWTSEDVSGIEMHTVTADGSAPLENVSSKETLTADGSATSEDVSGNQLQMVAMNVLESSDQGALDAEQDLPTSDQDMSVFPEKEVQQSTASGVPTSEQGVSETADESASTYTAVGETSTDKGDMYQDFENTPEQQMHVGNDGNSVATVSSTQQ